jgi:thiol-disulfide isomerase/thioredoxin
MKLESILLSLALLAATLFFSTAAISSADGTVVTKMSIDEFENIMTNKDCRCMIVAMAAWCRPCRKELPVLNKLYMKYKNRGLSLIGVSVDPGGPNAIQPVITKTGVTFPVYWVGDDAVRKYKIFGIPMIFLIKNGEIVEKIPGERPEAYLEKKIEALLNASD